MNKINFHFTDVCNYSCKYCFAKKENKYLHKDQLIKVIDNCKKYFDENNISNPTINLAGGEIFTYSKLDSLIDYINSKDIDCSIITNGYGLNDEFLKENLGKISQIGISIDSLDDETNIKIGRCLKNHQLLTSKDYLRICKRVIEFGYKLKINICVSKMNYREVDNFKTFLNHFRKKDIRIKVMRMVVVDNRNPTAIKYQLTDEEFTEFAEGLSNYNVEVENENVMFTKYLMINSDANVIVHNENGTDIVIGNIIDDYQSLNRAVEKVKDVRRLLNRNR